MENELDEAFNEQLPIYDKRRFCPFKEERDHLGRLIDSVSFLRTYIQMDPACGCELPLVYLA